MIKKQIYYPLLTMWVCLLLGLSGCRNTEPEVHENLSQSSTNSQMVNPTEQTIVAEVNGTPIFLGDFEERVTAFQQNNVINSVSNNPEAEATRLGQIRQQVLDGLIDRAIIAQAAQREGIVVSEDALNAKIAELKQGQSEAEFNTWLALNNDTYETFKQTLHSQLIAAEMFAYIGANVPQNALQVQARHLLVRDVTLAQNLAGRLQAGEDFIALAQQFSEDEATRLSGGDLGWFPMGIQFVPPQVEAVAFSLNPGEISPVIESVLGYHLVKVEGRTDNMPLKPEYRQTLQINMFNQWLEQQRASSEINRYIN